MTHKREGFFLHPRLWFHSDTSTHLLPLQKGVHYSATRPTTTPFCTDQATTTGRKQELLRCQTMP